ncbi:glycosyltransferase family 2 protein [Brevibacillus migulae]|uniref:glycosyltransferase family 2 protein n=1 Tax=Brevibacillus migulae TaxID=1644114 RepID=UPI00106E9426|nr:glycosyltransferase family 2 protein [Brevibacillus migulae]
MKISACVITKNEERNLPRCLDSVKDIVSEIIVVDTGSTDKTVDIALSYHATVLFFEWVNDFAQARNYALEHATGDWIIFLDADEYFSPDTVPLIKQQILEAEENNAEGIAALMLNFEQVSKQVINTMLHVRIFKKAPYIKYVGAIHERIENVNEKMRVHYAHEVIQIIHTGYSIDTVVNKQKSDRNLEILYKELENKPESSDLCFYIAESLMVKGEYEKALEYANRMLCYNNSSLMGIYEKNYLNILSCMLKLQRSEKEIVQIIKDAIAKYPGFPDFYIFLGDFYKAASRYEDAIEVYQTGLNLLDNFISSQSNAHSNINTILVNMGIVLYKAELFPNCVEKLVQSLNVDRYHFLSLQFLMRVFSKFEKPYDILQYFKKIYNYSDRKDIIYLVRASLEVLPQLSQYYFDLLDAETQLYFKEEKAYLALLNGDFQNAMLLYHELSNTESKEKVKYSVHAIASAYLGGNLEQYKEEHRISETRVLLESLLEKKSVSSSGVVEIWAQLLLIFIKVKKIDELVQLKDALDESQLVFMLANALMESEHFSAASMFFDEYFQKRGEMFEREDIDGLINYSECLLISGDLGRAEEILNRVKFEYPEKYRVYYLLVKTSLEKGNHSNVVSVVEDGLIYFPDSVYLQKLKHIVSFSLQS